MQRRQRTYLLDKMEGKHDCYQNRYFKLGFALALEKENLKPKFEIISNLGTEKTGTNKRKRRDILGKNPGILTSFRTVKD